jgi:serine/threonine-protein kinase
MTEENGSRELRETRRVQVPIPGTVVSHYEILGKIGEGGMGVVYRARDTKLGRNVALKFLPGDLTRDREARGRFVQEARAASALDHPNICTIYEIGDSEDERMFIAMACYDGETLADRIARGPLPLSDAVDVALQVAKGLDRAHRKGIVHRDIKPANIMLLSDGPVKIMDFGLAKLAGEIGVTRAGTTVGTVAYMSPEQARGEEVDSRSDLWSLGVVLYEMLTGERPFTGDNWQVVLGSITRDEPAPLTASRRDVPQELLAAVVRCLRKEKELRYQTASELVPDLESVRRSLEISEMPVSSDPVPSVAVLPFLDMSPERDQEYFCDGMAEELINALSKLEGLRVASRTSAFQFRGKGHDIGEIGVKLNVQKVLEGGVRKAGNRLRVTAQLVNTRDGYHIWSEKFDRDLEDVFSIQDELALMIVDNLKVKLLGNERRRLLERHTDDPEAYALYTKGRYFWNKRTPDAARKAIECFEQAIRKDPDYAMAYVGLADAHIILGQDEFLIAREEQEKAREAVLAALRINDSLGEAYATLGWIKTCRDWDHSAAEEAFRRSIKLSPGYATAHHWYGIFLADGFGRFDEAISELKRARELDPLSLVIARNLGCIYYMARRYDAAIETLKQVIEMDDTFPGAHGSLADVYLYKGMYPEALEEVARERAFNDDPATLSYIEPTMGRIYAAMGNEKRAREILEDQLTHLGDPCVSEVDLAALCFALGEDERGFELLEIAESAGDFAILTLRQWLEFDRVRSHPRFVALQKRIGLAD